MAGKKLIRDRIPEILRQNGVVFESHIAEEAEYRTMLNQKLQEEANEFRNGENVEELADVLEVLHAIAKFKGVSMEDLETIRKKKAIDRGSFDKKIILDSLKQEVK